MDMARRHDVRDGQQDAGAGPGGPAIELVYRATESDMAEALRVRGRRTAAGRRTKWLFLLAGTLFLLVGVLLLGDGRSVSRAAGFLAGGAALWALVLLGPRLQARAFRGLLEKAGETRAVVDDTGVSMTTAATECRIGWAAQPAYAETDTLFLMLSGDKGAVAMTLLPKRGVRHPVDVDRLRAVLDANLRRL